MCVLKLWLMCFSWNDVVMVFMMLLVFWGRLWMMVWEFGNHKENYVGL